MLACRSLMDVAINGPAGERVTPDFLYVGALLWTRHGHRTEGL
mgnify:CR=1 FL=1